MGMKQAVTGGVELTRPKASINWMTGAIFGFALIAVAMSTAAMLKSKAGEVVGKASEASGIQKFFE